MIDKIKVKRSGIVHYMAHCQDCNWDSAIFSDEAETPQDVRNKVYSHIRKTKHSVHVEAGNSTKYYI